MNTKQRKRQRDIKTKLMAAICMLLVSSIMMVSTTYAWFTLSTAPEVTGITTAVGANGNLEMALLPANVELENLDSAISSAVGDSKYATGKTFQTANITWGNLVDVSEGYGLDLITLYPSKLNTTVDNTDAQNIITSVATNPLQFPEYGADGRVTTLVANATLTGNYVNSGFSEGGYGVRAVGTSSSMSDRELAYRSAMAAASAAAGEGAGIASRSLSTNGSALADIIVKHATNTDDSDTYSATELAIIQTIVTDLVKENGALKNIEESLKQYILAATLLTCSDDVFTTYKAAIEAATLEDLVTDGKTTYTPEGGTATEVTVTLPAGIYNGVDDGDGYDTGYYGKLKKSMADADAATAELETLASEEEAPYEWAEISVPLNYLINYNSPNMKINDWTVSQLLAKDEDGNYLHLGDLAGAAMGDGLTLKMGTGSGIYADIADFCGDYFSSIEISTLSYQGITVPPFDASMTTVTSVDPTYLNGVEAAVRGTSNNFSSGGNSITTFYGYIIDLAFRTNVADSSLQLQTEAVDRIYEDNTSNQDTMGGGSSMTFASAGGQGFNNNQVKSLMGSLRVVFFETASNKILGYARLDAASASESTEGVTMDLVMWDEENNAQATDAAIAALEQNKAKAISVLVYLDGESVTNADVANAAQSMTGSMNLQFSSSSDLVPMEYSDLRNGTGEAAGDDEADDLIPLNVVTVNGATKGTAVYDGTNIAIKLTNVIEGSTATIKVGDAEAVPATINTVEGVTVLTHAASNVAADTVIVVTVTEPAAGG